jgi:hypothetical protein
MAFQDFRLNVYIGPEPLEQLILSYQPTGSFNQELENGERLGRQQNPFVRNLSATPKALVCFVQPERWELFHDGTYIADFIPRTLQPGLDKVLHSSELVN